MVISEGSWERSGPSQKTAKPGGRDCRCSKQCDQWFRPELRGRGVFEVSVQSPGRSEDGRCLARPIVIHRPWSPSVQWSGSVKEQLVLSPPSPLSRFTPSSFTSKKSTDLTNIKPQATDRFEQSGSEASGKLMLF